MCNIFKRIRNFINRSKWLGKIMGNPVTAGLFFIMARIYKRVPGRGRYGDFTFHFRGYDLPVLREFFLYFEYDVLKPFLESRQSPVIVDIGSHIGLFSLWALNIHSDAHILSVEASPVTYRILLRNIAQARKTMNVDWHAIHRAAWSKEEIVRFSDVGNSMSHRVSKAGSVEALGITLRDVLGKAGSGNHSIDIMKIDVEGAEEEFLCAYPEELKKVKRLIIELHHKFCDTKRVENLLRKYFSKVEYVAGRNSPKPLLYCEK